MFVLRAFEDDDVTGPSDPLEHLRVVEIELALADLETVEKRLAQVERQSKLDKTLGDELDALQRRLRRRSPTAGRSTGPASSPTSASRWRRTSC